MKTLKRQELSFDCASKHAVNILKDGNELSSELLNLINLKDGVFFTLLPESSTIDAINEFESGGVLPQNRKRQQILSRKRSSYSIIPTIQNKVGKYILKKIRENKSFTCIFEEILDSPESPQLDFFRRNNLIRFYKNEVYYVVNSDKCEEVLISNCLKKSNAIWHSVCVLTNSTITDSDDKKIHCEDMRNICLHANLIIIGAYDGEGYIFWERQ